MTRAVIYSDSPVLALGVMGESSLVHLVEIPAPFSKAVSKGFELPYLWVLATMVELVTWVLA